MQECSGAGGHEMDSFVACPGLVGKSSGAISPRLFDLLPPPTWKLLSDPELDENWYMMWMDIWRLASEQDETVSPQWMCQSLSCLQRQEMAKMWNKV